MAKSFFKNLVVMENVVLSDEPKRLMKDGSYDFYSDEAKQLVVDIREWLLKCNFTTSKTSRFICQNYNKTCEVITNLWNKTAKKSKSAKTFNSQISTLSSHLYVMLGSDCFDAIIQDNHKMMEEVRLRLNLFTEDITFNDYPIEMFKYYVSDTYSGKTYTLDECEQEIKMLKTLRRSTLSEYMEKADTDKLAYLKVLLNTPLLNQHTKKLNEQKMELIRRLDDINGESYADIVVSYLQNKQEQDENSTKDFEEQVTKAFGVSSDIIKELIMSQGVEPEREESVSFEEEMRKQLGVTVEQVKALLEKEEREKKLLNAYGFMSISDYIVEIGKYNRLNRKEDYLSSDTEAFAEDMKVFNKEKFFEMLHKYNSDTVLNGLHELRK